MAGFGWMRISLLAATKVAAIAVLARTPGALAQESPQTSSASPTAPVESPEQAIQRDLAQQAVLLTNPNSKPEQREQAAERLVLRQRPDAREILLKALSDPERPAQLAVAKALAGDAHPDARFIEPLLALMGRDWGATEAAVGALTNYGDNPKVLADLIAFAGNTLQVPRSRIATVRGIGTFVKKSAATFLMGQMNNSDEDSQIRDAASDAMLEMTGLQQFGRDVQQWNGWWASTSNQPDAQWEAAQYRNRASHYAQVRRELERLTDSIKDVLVRDYNRAPEAQRTDMVLGWLKNKEPSVRGVAASIVIDQKLNGERIAVPIIDQLRSMIGDSSVSVRMSVIDALKVINDAASVDPLLSQLAVETDPVAKIKIAQALGPLRQLKSVDALLVLLNGPVTRVAEAGSEAIRDLGDEIRKDPALAAKISANLRGKLDLISDKPGTDNLRGTILEALSRLHDAAVLRLFSAALDANNPRNTLKIRIAAARGLGNMLAPKDQEQAADVLVNALRDEPESAVRLEAVNALRDVGTFDQAEPLYRQMFAPAETDPSVRAAAWTALAKTFKRREATANVLITNWVDRFKDNPALSNDPAKRADILLKRRAVLEEARDKLIVDVPNDPQAAKTLAGVQQYIGETKMAQEQWGSAVASFQAAIKYWKENNGSPVVLAPLSDQLMNALLRSGSYAEAIQFAVDPAAAESNARRHLIRAEVERLLQTQKPDDLKNASQLLDEAEKMNPPLTSPYSDQLKQLRDDVRQRLEK